MYNNMAEEFRVKAPVAFGTSPPRKLAAAVVRAAKRDVPEITVNPTPIRPLIALAVFAPRLALWIVMKLGGGFFGVIVWSFTQPDYFSGDRLEPADPITVSTSACTIG